MEGGGSGHARETGVREGGLGAAEVRIKKRAAGGRLLAGEEGVRAERPQESEQPVSEVLHQLRGKEEGV